MGDDGRVFRCADDLLRIDHVSRESLPALETYVALLAQWQQRINLIGPATVADIWHRHIADSLQLLAHLPRGARTIVDLGSGAGLPGLVLAIALMNDPEVTVHLIESNGKKAAFLREAARQTGARVAVHQARIESLDSDPLQGPVDAVVARALAPLPKLLELARIPLENGATALFHKGRDADRELTEAAKYWNIRHTRIASLTEAEACILKIEEVTRVTCQF